MIVVYPQRVFVSVGTLERNLINSAEPFLKCLEETVLALGKGVAWRGVSLGVGKDLSSRFQRYLRAFKDWKISDASRQAADYRVALVALEGALRGLEALGGEGGDGSEGKRVDILKNMELLRYLSFLFCMTFVAGVISVKVY